MILKLTGGSPVILEPTGESPVPLEPTGRMPVIRRHGQDAHAIHGLAARATAERLACLF